MKKILIVNPFGIGDVLFTTPMIAALKARFPGVSLSYLGNTRTAPFLKNDSRINKVFSYDRDEFVAVYRQSPWKFLLKWKGLVDDLKAEQFDVVFDLSLNLGLGFALLLAGIPQRIGFNYKGRGRFLTKGLLLKGYEGRHVAEYYFELLEAVSQGAKVPQIQDQRMKLFVSPEDTAWAEVFVSENSLVNKTLVALYPGGGASWGKSADLKRWPAVNYAKLADKIVEKASCVIILMGDRAETGLCETVAAGMTHQPIVLAGRTSLSQAAALMKRCRFAVVNDGGPLHVAVASGVQTVSIFGPVDSEVYGPFPREGHAVVTKGLPCQPCYRNFRMSDCQHVSCLKTLTVDEVWRKVVGLL